MNNVTHREGANTVTSALLVEPDFFLNDGKRHCCSIRRPWYPPSLCMEVYAPLCIIVYRCVYITLRPRQSSVCAWLARMIYCATWGLVHDLAVPRSTLPMVPSCNRNCNTERKPCVFSTQTHTFCFLKSGLTVQHLHHPPPINGGGLLQMCVRVGLDTGKASLIDVSQLHTCFNSTWSTVGSRPLSERSTMTSAWFKCHLAHAGISITISHQRFPEHYHISFGWGNPEPPPGLLSI